MDGMTIDEVIKYFDDDAKENEKLAIIYRGNDDDMAEMHKQDAIRSSYVAEWLRELKMYREVIDNKSFKITDPLDPHRHQVLVVKVTDLYNDFFDFQEVNADVS